nr:MAG TPA: hypothetical protein [Caudoviricetes sp.]
MVLGVSLSRCKSFFDTILHSVGKDRAGAIVPALVILKERKI